MKSITQFLILLFVSTVVFARQHASFTDFLGAMRKMQTARVTGFLNAGFDINSTDEDGRTVLHHLATQGALNGVNFLLANGANTIVNNTAQTPFDEAVDARQFKVAAILLKDMRGINGRDQQGWTPLNFGVLSGDKDFVQSLLAQGAGVREGRYQNSLKVAVLMEDREMTALLVSDLMPEYRDLIGAIVSFSNPRHTREGLVKIMLEECLIDPNTMNEHGDTALLLAINHGQSRIVEMLLEHGADPDLVSPLSNHQTSLVFAAEKKNPQIAKVLLNHRAESKDLASPLITTAEAEQLRQTALMLKETQGVVEKDVDGWTSFDWAVFSDDTDLVRSFLAAGADIMAGHFHDVLEIATQAGSTAMVELLTRQLADRYDLIEILHEDRSVLRKAGLNIARATEILLKHRDPNTVNEHGDTPLMWATHLREEETVQVLLANGADPNLVSPLSKNQTPLLTAVEARSARIVKILLANGADPHAITENGDTALSIAEEMLERSTVQPDHYTARQYREIIAALAVH